MYLCRNIVYVLATFSIATAEKGDFANMCKKVRNTDYFSWNCTGTECDFYLDIGYCVSCDISPCSVAKGDCFMDLEVNESHTAKVGSGQYNFSAIKSCQDLNDRMCGAMNREGFLCSQCKPGYGPAPYSSTGKCVECKDGSTRQWLLYLALELVPSTVFYFVVILFNVRTTAPPYTAFVFFSQFFAFLYMIHPFIRLNLNFWINKILLHSILTLVSFWNLDFFRHVVPPFCISSKLTDLDVLLLQCISTFYPLLLVVLTFICIELHARNFRPLVILWKPIHKHLANCRRKLDPKSSMIAAFATFMSLSFSKILTTTLLAAFPGTYTIASDTGHKRVRALYDSSIQGNTSAEYWKQLAATPYFIPLLIVFIIAQLPTLLLLLYPIKAFRRLLTCCGSSRYHAIYVFIDTFQGHYKDGTNGSRDYRAASSISFLLKILFCLILSNGHLRYGVPSHSFYSISLAYILVIVSLFYGIIQPCKKKYMNVIESVVYCAVGLILLSLGSSHSTQYRALNHMIGIYIGLYISLIFLALPSLIIFVTFIAKISMCLCFIRGNKLVRRAKRILICKSYGLLPQELPDRLEHPLDYEPLN